MNVPPQFNGSPLSAITPIRKVVGPNYPSLWMWAALWEPSVLSNTLESINWLVERGYVQAPSHIGNSPLATQLYQVVYVADQPGTSQYWYKPIEGSKEIYPVTLLFSIDANPAPDTIPMLNALPLPQLGEYALVEHEGILVPYHILKLPLEARQRWVQLGEQIKELSSPLLWPAFREYHQIAADDIEYTRTINSIETQSKIAIGNKRMELILQGGLIQGGRIHIDQLRKALNKETWLQQWQEIQRMARDLAHDYYEYHQRQTDPQPPTELLQDIQAITTSKSKREKRPRQPITPIVAKGKEALTVKSDIVNREIINALRDKESYTPYKEQGVAEHKHRFFQRDAGQITITLTPQEGENFDTILHAINTLGDGCVDTFIALQAMAIDMNGVQHIRTPIEISPDDILEVCGKQKSHGSYTPHQRADVIKHLKTLSQAHVIATYPGQPPRRGRPRKGHAADQGTFYKAEGALIDLLSWKIGEYSLITGEEVWERRSISVGKWVTMIPELSEKTSIMLRQLLAYSAKNERYQKRLGVYLTFLFRINARNGGRFPNDISMGALLEGAGIVPPREQGQFKEAIERALERLKQDNIIGNYWRVYEGTPKARQIEQEVHERKRGWFDSYLQLKWNFSPPQATLQQYKKMLKNASEEEE